MFCLKCGNKLNENSTFCEQCGAKVGGNAGAVKKPIFCTKHKLIALAALIVVCIVFLVTIIIVTHNAIPDVENMTPLEKSVFFEKVASGEFKNNKNLVRLPSDEYLNLQTTLLYDFFRTEKFSCIEDIDGISLLWYSLGTALTENIAFQPDSNDQGINAVKISDLDIHVKDKINPKATVTAEKLDNAIKNNPDYESLFMIDYENDYLTWFGFGLDSSTVFYVYAVEQLGTYYFVKAVPATIYNYEHIDTSYIDNPNYTAFAINKPSANELNNDIIGFYNINTEVLAPAVGLDEVESYCYVLSDNGEGDIT